MAFKSPERDILPYEPKPGEVGLFENEKMGSETAPDHQGYIVAHRDIKAGEKVAIALWAGRAGSARSFGGRISDLPSAADKRPQKPTDLFGNPIPSDAAQKFGRK